MASNTVLRRLAEASKMIYVEKAFDDTPKALPEQLLWLAVIERAILDYCWPEVNKGLNEKHTLHWFFFTKESKPCNLTYICNMIFDDSEDAAKRIRHRLTLLKNSNITEADFCRARCFKG